MSCALSIFQPFNSLKNRNSKPDETSFVKNIFINSSYIIFTEFFELEKNLFYNFITLE